jgi:anti-sigma B factor antagonist
MGRAITFGTPQALEFHHRANGDVVLSVTGDVDVSCAAALRDALLQLIDKASDGACVVLDVRRMSFIDSTGLGVLVGARRHARSRGVGLVVAAPTPATTRVLEVTGLTTLFEIRDDLDA